MSITKTPCRLAAILTLALCAALLAAPALAAKIQLTWFANCLAGIDQLRYYEQVAAEFNRTHSDIEVTLIPATSSYYEQIPVFVASGTPIDLVFNQSPTPQAQGLFMDLTPLIERDKTFRLSDYQPIAVEYGRNRGKPGYYTLPNHLSTHGFYYNVDAFLEAGLATPNQMVASGTWTWDNFIKLGQKVLQRSPDGKVTRVFNTGLMVEAFMSTFGAQIIAMDGAVERSAVRTEAMQAALETYARLYAEQAIGPGSFVGGSAMMEAEWNDRFFKYEKALFEVDTVRYPKGLTNNVMISGGGWAIPVTTQNPEAAWELLKFVVSDYALTKFCEVQPGTIPAKVRLAQAIWRDTSWGTKHKYEAFLGPILTDGVVHERKYAPSWNVVFPALYPVFSDLQGGRLSPTAAIETMDTIINANLIK